MEQMIARRGLISIIFILLRGKRQYTLAFCSSRMFEVRDIISVVKTNGLWGRDE